MKLVDERFTKEKKGRSEISLYWGGREWGWRLWENGKKLERQFMFLILFKFN
jgi:hypothetical protein